MKIVKFIPSICSGENAEWEGFISFTSPTYGESNDLKKQVYYDSGNISESKNEIVENIDRASKIVELASKFIKDVYLKKKDGSSEALNIEDINSDDELHATLQQVSLRIVIGPNLGKK